MEDSGILIIWGSHIANIWGFLSQFSWCLMFSVKLSSYIPVIMQEIQVTSKKTLVNP